MLHVIAVEYVGDKKLNISFDDGNSGVIDLSGNLIGPVFEPLRRNDEFAKVVLDEELETVVWPNGADFAPEFLRDLLLKQNPNKRSA